MVFTDLASLLAGLEDLASGRRDAARGACTRPALLFAGSERRPANVDPAWFECEPVARTMLDRCDAVAVKELGRPVSDRMFARSGSESDPEPPSVLLSTRYVLECIQCALWRNAGPRPTAVYGQGDGRVAAGYAAGVVSLEDGFRIAVARGRMLEALSEGREAGEASSMLDACWTACRSRHRPGP